TNVCATTNNTAAGGTLIVNTLITDPPLFVGFDAQNYHLATNSPCRDAGLYQAWMDTGTDLDGNPRIMQGIVDIGCYERPGAGKPHGHRWRGGDQRRIE
ncbi:MAG: choice-of-anchor Q domain-containing protein, partial [Kiritimatiellia bacterium]